MQATPHPPTKVTEEQTKHAPPHNDCRDPRACGLRSFSLGESTSWDIHTHKRPQWEARLFSTTLVVTLSICVCLLGDLYKMALVFFLLSPLKPQTTYTLKKTPPQFHGPMGAPRLSPSLRPADFVSGSERGRRTTSHWRCPAFPQAGGDGQDPGALSKAKLGPLDLLRFSLCILVGLFCWVMAFFES